MIQKLLGFLFLFVLSPLCTGLLWRGRLGKKREWIWDFYLPGFLTQLAVFQVIAVPVMIFDAHGMELLVILSCTAFGILALAGYIVMLVGLYTAGKADDGYRTAFFLTIASLILGWPGTRMFCGKKRAGVCAGSAFFLSGGLKGNGMGGKDILADRCSCGFVPAVHGLHQGLF